MSDSKKPNPSQPAFLPRTWKAEPEPVEEPTPAAPSQKKSKTASAAENSASPPKKKNKKAVEGEETTGPKLEETPLLDTFEGRRRVRYAIGGVMTLVAVIAILLVVNKFQASPPKVDPGTEKKDVRTAIDARESAEREAAALLENARQADKFGRGVAAVDLLRRIARNYDGTEAGKVAAAALDRERRNRPLFEADPAKNPTGPTPPIAATNPTPPTGPVGPATAASATAPASPTGPTPPAVTSPTASSPVKPPEILARSLPNGFRPDPTAPILPSGWPKRIICDRDNAAMVLVPAGEFLMGRDDGDSSERPSHRVKVSTFYIDEHEVTNRQYQFYLRETGRPADPNRASVAEETEVIPADRLDLPAISLTAREARAYCYWANKRLPTEAQWEMAARSSAGHVSYGLNPDAAKGEGDRGRNLEPVMSTPNDRSPFGAFDLAGNAWEWTGDYYDSKYYYALKELTSDPSGPAQSRIKPAEVTVKGGSKAGYLTWREGIRIESKYPYLGFRGALSVDLPAPSTPAAQPNQPGVNPPGGAIPF